ISRAEYDRLIGVWLAHGRRLPPTETGAGSPTVNELILAYWRFAESHYRRGGIPTRHGDTFRDALRPVRQLYGHTRADAFDPAALKTVRRAMIDAGLCRTTVNN